MSEQVPQDVLDENLRRLIASSVRRASPEFEEKLVGAVLAEVHSQRRIRVRRRWQTGFAAAAAAAVIVLAVIVSWSHRPDAPQYDPKPPTGGVAAEASRVTPRYGLVSAEADQSSWQLADPQPIRAGQWIETHWGSEAAILLADQSRIALRPRTRVQVPQTSGRKVILARGTVRIEASRQPPGKSITVETPGSGVTVLGTRLEVHVAEKPDGRTQTRVQVTSGEVAFRSGGTTVQLHPNMVALADEGQPPVTRSLTAEVNALVDLLEENRRMADVPAGQPAIVEYRADGSATVWCLLSIENPTGSVRKRQRLQPTRTGLTVAAFTLQGATLPVAPRDDAWEVDLARDPIEPGERRDLILKVSGVTGLFIRDGSGVFDLRLPADDSGALALFQIRLPASAHVETVTPGPVSTSKTLSRLAVTIAAPARLPELFE